MAFNQNAGGDLAGVPLDERIAGLVDEFGEEVPVEEVAAVVDSIMGSLHGDLTPQDLRVYGELERLARYIYQAKQEISEIRPEDISQEHIPTASDELDAIGSHLEDATGTILDACEELESLGDDLEGDANERLNTIVTNIYEACNFQDLTGQRITKIVTTLQNIEKRIELLLRAFGHEPGQTGNTSKLKAELADSRSEDEKLLNGPQVPQNANSQEDIDALFAGFD